jgi:ADP-ribosyl-[dinitrogen reductase] hydrolase
MAAESQREQIEGAIWGLLVGDALGVPYEFHPASGIPAEHLIELDPPPGFRRSHAGVAPGTWSDDGAHALCLLASLLHCGQLDPEDLMRRLTNWYELGYLAVGGNVFDIGVQTSRALQAFRHGSPAIDSGPRAESDNGNGSLMRVLPLALWHRGDDAELVRDAHLQSRVTHGHSRAQVCCALYCLWARCILGGDRDAWNTAVARLRGVYGARSSQELEELDGHIRPDDEPSGSGSGYVVDCLRSARLVLNAGNYESVVRAAIRLGNDTDTTACVAGGLAGLRDGIGAIPSRWRNGLREPELFHPLLDSLLELHGLKPKADAAQAGPGEIS